MVFQEPMTALNPVYTIGDPGRRKAARPPVADPPARGLERAVELLDRSGSRRSATVPSASAVGRQRQRVMIAMALSCRPEVLIADEPTTAL